MAQLAGTQLIIFYFDFFSIKIGFSEFWNFGRIEALLTRGGDYASVFILTVSETITPVPTCSPNPPLLETVP